MTGGWGAPSPASSSLFLGGGVVSLRGGEGVACRWDMAGFFFSGLAPPPAQTGPLVTNLDDNEDDGDRGDRGDLVTLTSSAPRARLFVGVALILTSFWEKVSRGGGTTTALCLGFGNAILAGSCWLLL